MEIKKYGTRKDEERLMRLIAKQGGKASSFR